MHQITAEVFRFQDIPKYIKQYDQKSRIGHVNNMVLLIGETGKGKTTLAEFLTGNTTLHAEGNPGAIIIVDKDDLISDLGSTIVSKTNFPRPVLQQGTGNDTCFLDCPGFRDTRGTNMDIACMVFLKKALRECRLAKIVFVLAYDDVKTGGQRNGFLDMVQQAGEFIANLDKFSNSTALFVTKVPCEVQFKNGDYELIPDELYRQNVVEFLQMAEKNILTRKCVAPEKRDLHEKALKLIRFLVGTNQQQSRIGIFRTPDRTGSLQDMTIMQQSKKNLHNIIENTLKYSEINEKDFGYSMSWESKVYIVKQIPDIVKESGQAWEPVVKEFIRIYHKWEINKTQIEELTKFFHSEETFWEEQLKALQKITITLEVYKHIYDHILKAKARITTYSDVSNDTTDNLGKATSELDNYTEVINLLEEVTNERFEQSTFNLLAPFTLAIDFLHTAKIWYDSLLTIFGNLSTYRYHKRNGSDITSSLERFLAEKACIPGDTEIETTPLYRSLSACFERDFSLPMKTITSARLEHLRQLYKMLFEKLEIEVSGDIAIIKGNYISLSSVSNSQTKNVRKLRVFAAHKVFIDCDFDKVGKNFELSICAPKWEVVGEQRKIVLDGEPGPDNETVAATGQQPGSSGQHGVAGHPGGNGGHFIGIVSEIVNCGNLEISVCGGRGGRGQKGGIGKDGDDGADAPLPESKSIWFWEGDLSPKADRVKDKNSGFSFLPLMFRVKETSKCESIGINGQPGGNGGAGGRGGAGGYPGSTSFIGIRRRPKIIAKDGIPGESGEGGQGGKGGKNGGNVKFEAIVERPLIDFINWKTELKHENIETEQKVNASDGTHGEKGTSELGFRLPEHNQHPDTVPVLNEYVQWLLNVTQSQPVHDASREFLDELKTFNQQQD